MNDTIFFYLYNLAHRSNIFDSLVIFFAETFPYLVVGGAFLFILLHREDLSPEKFFQILKQKWKGIVLVFSSGVLAWIFAEILKKSFQTPRPFLKFPDVVSLFPETGFAFPSQHTVFFTAIAMAIFFYHKKVGYIFLIFAILIGLARIIAGVHFPIDILGGFILGIFTAYIIKIGYDRLTNKS